MKKKNERIRITIRKRKYRDENDNDDVKRKSSSKEGKNEIGWKKVQRVQRKKPNEKETWKNVRNK